MLLERRRDFIAVKIDMRNAHNEVSRASVIEVLDREPSLKHLTWHTAACLAPRQGLESGGNIWGRAEEGACQGDPEAGIQFNMARRSKRIGCYLD